MATVTTPFQTRQRRFALGARVTERDDLSPHSFERLVDLGFIERLPISKPKRSAKQSAAAKAAPQTTAEPAA